MQESDELDQALLGRIIENEGCSIRDAVRPFLAERSESALRDRIRALELKKLIRTSKTKKEVRCYSAAVGVIDG